MSKGLVTIATGRSRNLELSVLYASEEAPLLEIEGF
jgi:hypothetical protein